MAQIISKIGVVGAGAMGHGIAQAFAQADFDVKLTDVSMEFVKSGIRKIDQNLSRSVEKGRLSNETKQAILFRIQAAEDLSDFSDRELVIEAATEKSEIKKQIFEKLSISCPDDCILASNTSSIPITQIANWVANPSRSIGMHFFNPVQVMKLIEIVKALQTSDATVDVIQQTSVRLGKTSVLVKDSPGFISNRVLCPMINEAIFALEEGIATKEDIDTVMKLGMNHPMGPLELADFVGLDVVLDVMTVLYSEFQDSKYRASPLLRRMVRAGYLGRKTKKGFYNYD